MRHAIKRAVTSKWLVLAAALILLYTLAGYFLLPRLIERYLPDALEQRLGLPVSIGNVQFNPYRLTLEAHALRVGSSAARPEAQPVVEFERLFVDFEVAASLGNRAWTFADVRLERLGVHAVIGPDGRLNLAQIADRLGNLDQGSPGGRLPQLVLRHAALDAAKLTLADLSGSVPASAALEPVNVEVTDVATLPDRKGQLTLTASLPEGGSLLWRGGLSLAPIESSGELRIDRLEAATVWRFFRDQVRLAQPDATVSLSARYRFAYAQQQPTLQLDELAAQLSDVALAPRGGTDPILALKRVSASGGRFSLASRELVVQMIELHDGTLAVAVDADGTLNWQTLLEQTDAPHARAPSSQSTTAEAPAGRSPAWRARIEAVRIDAVALGYHDKNRATPLAVEVSAVTADLQLAATVGTGPTTVRADSVDAQLGRIRLVAVQADEPLVSVASLLVAGGHIDTGARRIGADRASIEGASATVARGEDGRINLAAVLGASELPAQPADAPGPATAPRASERAWQYALGALSLRNVDLALIDRGYEPPVAYRVALSAATLSDVGTDPKTPMPFEAALRVAEGGTIHATGTVASNLGSASAELKLDGVALAPLNPLLARYATLDLKTGALSASVRVTYQATDAQPSVQANGALSVADVRINEAPSGDRFLAWKTLSADDVAFSLAPNRLVVGQVELVQPGAKVVISKDNQLNVAQILKGERAPEGGPGAGDTVRVAAPASASEAPRRAPWDIRIARVRFRDGEIDFADLSLVLPFSTRVQALNGAVVDVSNGATRAAPRRASVKAAGQIASYGSASIEGDIEAFNPRTYTDLHAVFQNVQVPPLSPYTATFAGRKIASGRLWLDLHYKIVDSELLGRNEVRIANLKLGERVKAPGALDLPLDLAVALLTDSNGEIEVAVPVRGDLGNPKFDIGTLVREALGNLVQRIVSAPFRALGNLLGLSGKDDGSALADIRFDFGSAALAPESREKLDKVAEGLKQRPQLKLVVQGPYDAQRDAQALRELRVRTELAQALGERIEPGEDPGPVAYGNAEAQRALTRMLRDRAGDDTVAALEREFELRTGRLVEPVDTQALPARASPDRAFYEAMFARLVELYPLPDSAPQLLGGYRAQAIAQHLSGAAGIARERIDTGRIRPVNQTSGIGVSASLQLDLHVGAAQGRARSAGGPPAIRTASVRGTMASGL